ncbi:MAG: hypothetical protein E1N59_837 [Puniceicoccaceae bacterium 5H]|nr:MAG: hypothetical protein E1N59_837 [Puniceicoccaceae bacterium 5H]
MDAAPTFPTPETVSVMWRRAYWVVPARIPTQNLSDGYHHGAAEIEMAAAIDSLTHPSRLEEAGDLQRVPRGQRLIGPEAEPAMQAFTHLSPLCPSRFSDGSYGVYYAAESMETALAEARFRFERWLRRTPASATDLQMRVIVNQIRAPLHDLRPPEFAPLFDSNPQRYQPAQAYARLLREGGAAGVLYRSVRREWGECVAVFRPDALTLPTLGPALAFHWNPESQSIDQVEPIDLGQDQ